MSEPKTTAQSRSSFPSLCVAAAAPIGLLLCCCLWILALSVAANLGVATYLSPAFLMLAVVVGGTACFFLGASDSSILVLLGLCTLGLAVNFRVRAAGEPGLDWQNGSKLVAWVFMFAVAVNHRASILALLRRDLGVKLAFAFCCFAATSSLWSAAPAITVVSSIGLFALFGFANVVALRIPEATFNRVLFWALGIEIILGLAAAAVSPSLAWMEPSAGETRIRLQGLSGHPNLLGQHAAIFLLAALGVWEAKAVSRVKTLVLGAAALMSLMGSDSRTAATAAFVAWAVVRLRRQGYCRLMLACGVAAAATGFLLASADVLPDIQSLMGDISRSGSAAEISTLTGRTELWSIAWEHFLQRPLLGWGYNGNEQLMMDSVGANFIGNPVNAHNLVFQSLMTLGLVGSATVLGFLACAVRAFFQSPNDTRDRLIIFFIVLGTAEAEFLTLPMVTTIFLGFWCVARNATEVRPPSRRLSTSH